MTDTSFLLLLLCLLFSVGILHTLLRLGLKLWFCVGLREAQRVIQGCKSKA